MEEQYLLRAIEILKKIHYLTIATVCSEGTPWNSPVSSFYDSELNFFWGSFTENIHSQNIRRDNRVFAVVYDSTAAEGTGEGVYMLGTAAELDNEDELIKKYCFTPLKMWVNDEAKNADGSYKHDIRIELKLDQLKQLL
jgi:hypothetical protein